MEQGLKKILIISGVIIIVTAIFSIVRSYKAKEKYKSQIEKMEIALKQWGEEYEEFLPKKNGESIIVPLRTLKQSGYIDLKFRNPKENMRFSNQLLLKIKKKEKEYQYIVLDQDKNMVKEYDDVNKKAPMIILKGNEIEYAQLNKPYEDAGYEAITINGKKEDEVKVEIVKDGKFVSKIDTTSLGTYHLTYHVSYAKEESVITRIVIVKDTEKPNVKMERLTITSEEAKNVDLLEGVTMSDNSEEKLKVEIIGSLASIPGRYVLTYKVSDVSGNFVEKKRVVRVEN